jgi:hypothetical protein
MMLIFKFLEQFQILDRDYRRHWLLPAVYYDPFAAVCKLYVYRKSCPGK